MDTTLDQELFGYILRLDEDQKNSVLQMLKSFVKGSENGSGRISIEQYNKEIDEAVASIEAGEFYTHEEVKRMAKDW